MREIGPGDKIEAARASDSLEGICPRDLLSMVSDTPWDPAGGSVGGRRHRPQPLPPGSWFGDYELLGLAGPGGMGVVYQARQKSLDRIVALKMLGDDGWESPVSVERLRAEAESNARLDHPHIVPVYEVGEHEGRPYFTMRLMEGGSLRDAMRDQPFSPERAAGLIAKVARAVHYAHQRGVLHRDIKPSNILLDAEGEPYLADFGLAKQMDCEKGLTLSDAVMGAPSYMSPEQASGKVRDLTMATDVYGLGAVLYELLTGNPPFAASTPVETLRQVIDSEPAPVRSLNAAVERNLAIVCEKCLEKDPQHRYPSAEALAEDLDRWLNHEPISARPVGWVHRVWRWVCNNRLATAFIILLATSLVGALAVLKVLWDESFIKREEDRVNAVWEDEDSEYVQFGPESLRVFAESASIVGENPTSRTHRVGQGTLHMIVAAHSSDGFAPVRAARCYAPLMMHLEGRLSDSLARPVSIEFRFYKQNRDAHKALIENQVDILRMGVYSFVGAQDRTPDIKLLARERFPEGKRGVIFVHKSAAIRRVEDLRGKSIVTGDPTSTTNGFWAPAFLMGKGISRQDLKAYTFHSKQGDSVRAVLEGEYDAGITALDKFPNIKSKRARYLRKLSEFDSSTPYWVSRRGSGHDSGKALSRHGLSDDVSEAVRNALIGLDDRAVLIALKAGGADGFEPVSEADVVKMKDAWGDVKTFFGNDWRKWGPLAPLRLPRPSDPTPPTFSRKAWGPTTEPFSAGTPAGSLSR